MSQLTLFYSLALLFVVSIYSSQVKGESDADDCPDPELIQPCHCDREGISCFSSLTDDKLPAVFQAPDQYNAYRSVWLTQNNITKLPARAFNGLRIYNFYIEENELETIEENALMGSYETIRILSLYKNKIQSFPFNELKLMANLQSLILSHNRLTTIPANSFSLAPKLTTVDLSNNQIETLEPGAFFGMQNLQVLFLANNKLTQLPALTFGSIGFTFQADLSGNEINFIDSSAFTNSIPVAINFANNQLTYLDPDIFELLIKAFGTLLDVGGNPLTCRDCNRYKWLLSVGSDAIINFQCTNGHELNELNLLNIGCIF